MTQTCGTILMINGRYTRMVWKRYQFANENSFNAWHNSEKLRLGYPIIGKRLSDGVPQPRKQQTINITVFDSSDKGAYADDAIHNMGNRREIPAKNEQ